VKKRLLQMVGEEEEGGMVFVEGVGLGGDSICLAVMRQSMSSFGDVPHSVAVQGAGRKKQETPCDVPGYDM
jgi:hypothetical protein